MGVDDILSFFKGTMPFAIYVYMSVYIRLYDYTHVFI